MIRRDGLWEVYRLEAGKRRRFTDFAIPASLKPDELAAYLDDMLHELAGPNRAIRRVE